MWEKLGDDGSIHDKDAATLWADAFAMKIATLNATLFGGYNDWRLPNVNELQSLANYSGVSPTVHAPFDTGCVAGCTVSGMLVHGCFGWVVPVPPTGPPRPTHTGPGQIKGLRPWNARSHYIDAYIKMPRRFVRAVRGGT